MNRRAQALWYTAPFAAELREAALAPPGSDEALVRTLWSGVSRGTERLVFAGRIPPSEFGRMRAPLQEGDFPFPVKYGYCAVGLVEEGPARWEGRRVFALHPHQDCFILPITELAAVPEGVPARRVVLAANMETALNGVWDAGCGPGDRIMIVGAGLVGLLIGALAGRLPGAEVTLIDVADRRAISERLGARFMQAPLPEDAAFGDADVVFHTSATAAGLALALRLAGREACIVEMSWYGAFAPAVPLGEAFHSRRLRLVSSQVGEVAASRRPRWTHRRRLETALALLADDRLDDLITEEVAFADLPRLVPRILAEGAPGLATAVRYDPR